MIPAFGHDNYEVATIGLGMKRKWRNDEDIPGVTTRGGGRERNAAATGANAVVPIRVKRA
jgi:hypothetical protein